MPVKHSVGEYVRDQPHVNGLESFWVLLESRYHGTNHHMSPQLKRYMIEFAGSHNHDCADTAEEMRSMVRGLLGKTLSYRQLTGKTAAACQALAAAAAPFAASRAHPPVCLARRCEAEWQATNPAVLKHVPGLKEVPKPSSKHSMSAVPGSGEATAMNGGTGRNHQGEFDSLTAKSTPSDTCGSVPLALKHRVPLVIGVSWA